MRYHRIQILKCCNASKTAKASRSTISVCLNGAFQAGFLLLDEAVASRAVFVIVSGSDGWNDGRAGGNAFAASKITKKQYKRWTISVNGELIGNMSGL